VLDFFHVRSSDPRTFLMNRLPVSFTEASLHRSLWLWSARDEGSCAAATGSTGEPKGVMCEHRCAVSYILNHPFLGEVHGRPLSHVYPAPPCRFAPDPPDPPSYQEKIVLSMKTVSEPASRPAVADASSPSGPRLGVT
jgi:hypothetical protein